MNADERTLANCVAKSSLSPHTAPSNPLSPDTSPAAVLLVALASILTYNSTTVSKTSYRTNADSGYHEGTPHGHIYQ